MPPVPSIRIQSVNEAPVRGDGQFVLYWMISNRRTSWNFSLQRAAEWARKLKKPLVVFEPLRADYPWASRRFHTFIIQGMGENRRALEGSPALYYPYIEGKRGAGKGLLARLMKLASVVVTDDYPCFFLPRMVAAAAQGSPVGMEAVDSNGLLPLAAADRTFKTAASFRRFIHRNLLEEDWILPRRSPLSGLRLPRLARPLPTLRRWPAADLEAWSRDPGRVRSLPVSPQVEAVSLRGGTGSGRRGLNRFLRTRLDRYVTHRNRLDDDASSGVSPYLHFGHLSSHEILRKVLDREGWSPERLNPRASGRRAGWWGLSESGEAFLDQLITWRELGFNMAWRQDDYDRYESLPQWAQATLRRHEKDLRPTIYTLEQLEGAQTHDPVWNEAQRQLQREGRVHGYLRMLWGKKILEWSPRPRDALAAMIELNNKYALDGRDPNSYSGVFWILGRYDRPWGPERPIFGKIRYMSSPSTARKIGFRPRGIGVRDRSPGGSAR